MKSILGCLLALAAGLPAPLRSADVTPATQAFRQEVAHKFTAADGLPAGPVQLIDANPGHPVRCFTSGKWFAFQDGTWKANTALGSPAESVFVFADAKGEPCSVPLPWKGVRQLAIGRTSIFLATANQVFMVNEGKLESLDWRKGVGVNQIAVSQDGQLYVAAADGLFRRQNQGWERVTVEDDGGRAWAVREVLGVVFDTKGRLWFATKAGVGCRTADGWRFFEGKDGLPWNDFTGMAAGPAGEVWLATHLGAIRFDGEEWQYRQGQCWLPQDEVIQIAVDAHETAWFATAGGLGNIERRPMTLAAKAEIYEQEIERYIKRTPFGYVAEAALRQPADKASASPQDSDNDGLWTSMYGAGECFAYAATGDPRAKARARQAFEALRFLQVVTQGCPHAPPPGYVARTIRPADWSDPNIGRIEGDRREHEHDRLWKVYEPRWPKSADGRWFWKSDTSSDELDGHYFFYPLYYDLCADTEAERERVRGVVRALTDHLVSHEFALIDHDGTPTRWGVYGPKWLNADPNWWPERGLKSLSILSYLAGAQHVTGEAKYGAAARELIDRYGYAHNAMYVKVQHGPGSGNQSDDEMAFMCFYNLLRYSQDTALKDLIRYSFFRSWANEQPEMNPFFNFAFAAQNLHASVASAWGAVPVAPWPGWQEEALATLRGFPLDRLNWSHRNSHRLDIVPLPRVRSGDLDSPDAPRSRGYRVSGKVLPVENRHFNHWNTDPWQLDYGGNGGELAAGTVFLLPYYMGLYHGFIAKP